MIGTAIVALGTTIINSVTGHFKGKQEIKKAVVENRVRMAKDEQSHNQDWEMKQLDNSGWKDDVLFYAILGLFVWSGIDPERSAEVFKIWETLPDWLLQITGWLVASVLGVKKIGEYLPGAIKGVKDVFKK